MFGWHEFQGESEYDRRHRGNIELQGDYLAPRKPAWLVLGKLATVLFVVGFAYLLALRHIDYPAVPMSALFFGGLLIYCGVAYFIRPNPNYQNMGWGGGLFNDPTQYSDNINRGLRDLECLLQPGQLAVESLLDLFILFGAHPVQEPTVDDEETTQTAAPAPRVLRADRFEPLK